MQHSLNSVFPKFLGAVVAPKFLWLGFVTLLSSAPSLPAYTQVLNCANVRVDPRTGAVSCADPPASRNPATETSPQPSRSPVPIGADSSPPQSTNSARIFERLEYDQLTTGMTLKTAISQIGQPDRTLDRLQLSTGGVQTTYQWRFQNGDITLYFINDALVGKASGLRHTEPVSAITTNPTTDPANSSIGTTPITILPPLSSVSADSTQHIFNRLETGINLNKAQTLLGQPGTPQVQTQSVTGEPIVVYSWQTSQGSITLMFQSDRLISKSWCGSCRF